MTDDLYEKILNYKNDNNIQLNCVLSDKEEKIFNKDWILKIKQARLKKEYLPLFEEKIKLIINDITNILETGNIENYINEPIYNIAQELKNIPEFDSFLNKYNKLLDKDKEKPGFFKSLLKSLNSPEVKKFTLKLDCQSTVYFHYSDEFNNEIHKYLDEGYNLPSEQFVDKCLNKENYEKEIKKYFKED